MGPEKLINTSSSPPVFSDSKNAHTGSNTCHPKETSAATFTTMFYTRLRKHFNHGHHHHYEKLNSVPSTAEAMPGPAKTATPRSRLNSLLSLISITTLIISTFITTVSANPVFVDNPGLAQFQSGRNIRHLPCIVRKSGRSGVCMFAIDCIKQNGTHLGTCIDRFYFGSCCDIKAEDSLFAPEIGDNSIDQNTISHHFTSESTTMPTSALFKLTTLGPSQNNHTMQQDQDIMTTSTTSNGGSQFTSIPNQQDTQRPTTQTASSAAITSRPTTTTKPQQSTTHKYSHFVIRTTAKPTKTSTAAKPSYNTTTRKKTTTTSTTSTTTTSTTTTTTSLPMLTTTPDKSAQDEMLFEVTTPPIKLFTFQTVETTVATPTEPTKVVDFVTTERSQSKTTKPHLTNTVPITATKASTTATPTTPYPRTTAKPKPQTSRKPTTTKKPSQNKRTTVKPFRKPLPSTAGEQLKPQIQNASSTTSPKLSSTVLSTTTSTVASTSTLSSTTVAGHKTTNGPRPRPKPTATVTKVPKPTTTNTKAPPKTTTPAPVTTTTTEEDKQSPPSSTTTPLNPLSTQFPTSAPATTTSTPTSSSKATTMSSTSIRPGLVTWTNVDAEPASPNKPAVSDWIPVTTVSPIIHNNIHVVTSAPEVVASVSTSINEVVSDNSIFTPQPQKPIISQTLPASTLPPTSAPKVPSTTYATTTTMRKPVKSTATTTTTSTTSTTERAPLTPTTITTTSTTNRPMSTAFATEMPLVSSTIEPQLNSTDTATESITTDSPPPNTTTPANSLEGVDYRQVCGRRMFPEPRIVGGSNAAFGRWPWQISLRQWRTSTYLHKCGAALLNENWAITAAHCVDNVPPSDLLLRLGEYDLAEEEEPYGYQERRVQIVASHPQFDPRTFEYDLALLRFYEPVTFQPNIIPVCVPDSDEDFIGQTAFVTGWGRLYEDGPLPSVLQEVAVPVINNTICESMYRSAGYIEHIPHIFICAGWKKGGYDSCEGDSGGPMVLQRESDKRFHLGGVISWGIGCAEANQPGVYTRISEFRDWINQILQF